MRGTQSSRTWPAGLCCPVGELSVHSSLGGEPHCPEFPRGPLLWWCLLRHMLKYVSSMNAHLNLVYMPTLQLSVTSQMLVLVATLCLTLFATPQAVHGISQARILELAAISFCRDWAHFSYVGRWILYHWVAKETLTDILHVLKSIHLQSKLLLSKI